tara:strand:+ start:2630 stop:3166 length:537 start_codon:yes stop_codon:yes gene_type:complete
MNLRFKVHGSLKGGFPLEDQEYDFVNGEDYYQELINLISQAEEEKALDLAKKEFGAEFIIENIEAFEEGFEFVETESVSLKSPFIEEIDGIKIPLFRWIEATFILEGPKEVIENWMIKNKDNKYLFSEELFDEWMEDNSGELQDGPGYYLKDVSYDLIGFGTNSCSIDKDSIEKSFNK